MTTAHLPTAARRSAALLAGLGWLALGVQLGQSVAASLAAGLSPAAALVKYFSYFTVQTNLLLALALSLLVLAPGSRAGRLAARPAAQGALLLYIAVVGILYELLLRRLWQPEGLRWLMDLLLHDVLPLGFALWWLAFAPRGRLRWRHAWQWLGYPLAYAAYALARGALTGAYPYPFLDLATLGLPLLLANLAALGAALLGGGLVIVALDQGLARRAARARVVVPAPD